MKNILIIGMCLILAACASTTSFTPMSGSQGNGPKIALNGFSGFAGQQASDMVAQELEIQGFDVVSTGGHSTYLMSGTCSAMGGPLYSFPHVNMTAKVVDTRTGQIVWIGRYGNAMWTSAISTQDDIQRGAHDLIQEFKKTIGKSWGKQ